MWAISNQQDRVLDFIARFPGRDDDEIASALKISPRQTVNQICRRLCQKNLVRRERGKRGKLVNFAITGGDQPAVIGSSMPRTRADAGAMTEDQVKAALVSMLEQKGWSVEVAWGRQRGIDIVALRGAERWVIECKGTGSLAPMQKNYFVSVVGELMQRMSDDRAKHSIAFPDVPKFRRLWSELPPMVKQRLQLSALFVANDNSVLELWK
jgi:MarR family protein/restriction endonuclease